MLAISAEAESEFEEFEEIFGSDLCADGRVAPTRQLGGVRDPRLGVDIRFALVLMGTERVRSLAVTLAMNRYARSAGAAAKPLLEHSIASAVIAEEFGRQLRASPAHLYTSGLTHDLGRLGLLLGDAAQYSDVLGQEFSDIDESLALERVHFGVTHCEAGAFLARSWYFPEALCRSILRHHDRLTPADDDFTTCRGPATSSGRSVRSK